MLMMTRLLMASNDWRFWPFDRFYPESWLPLVAKILFVAAILGGMLLVLRKLYGPGGRLREDWVETIQEGDARRAKERADKKAAIAANPATQPTPPPHDDHA